MSDTNWETPVVPEGPSRRPCCVTHHDACDCREAAHAAELARLRAENAELLAACEAMLVDWDLHGGKLWSPKDVEDRSEAIRDALRAIVAKAKEKQAADRIYAHLRRTLSP